MAFKLKDLIISLAGQPEGKCPTASAPDRFCPTASAFDPRFCPTASATDPRFCPTASAGVVFCPTASAPVLLVPAAFCPTASAGLTGFCPTASAAGLAANAPAEPRFVFDLPVEEVWEAVKALLSERRYPPATEDAGREGLAALRLQLQQALAQVEEQEKALAAPDLPATLAEAEDLEARLRGALDELLQHKETLKNNG